MRELKAGDIVKNFKYELSSKKEKKDNMYMYRILTVATHTETEEQLIIYQAMYGKKEVFARPLYMFYEKVDKEKYPNVKQERRFEFVDYEPPIVREAGTIAYKMSMIQNDYCNNYLHADACSWYNWLTDTSTTDL